MEEEEEEESWAEEEETSSKEYVSILYRSLKLELQALLITYVFTRYYYECRLLYRYEYYSYSYGT